MREGLRRMEEGLFISYFLTQQCCSCKLNVDGNLGIDGKIIFRNGDERSNGRIYFLKIN